MRDCFVCFLLLLGPRCTYTTWGEDVTDNVIDGQNINGVGRKKVDVHNYYSDHEGWWARSVLLNECIAYCAFVN